MTWVVARAVVPSHHEPGKMGPEGNAKQYDIHISYSVTEAATHIHMIYPHDPTETKNGGGPLDITKRPKRLWGHTVAKSPFRCLRTHEPPSHQNIPKPPCNILGRV